MTETAPSATFVKPRWLAVGFLSVAVSIAGLAFWQLRETDEEQARRFLAEATSLRQMGDYSQAEELAQSALDRDPKLTEAALLAARCAAAQGEFQQAIEYARRAVVPGSEYSIEPLLLIAEISYHDLYALSAAEEAYRAALAIDPDNLDANAELARLLGVCGRGREAVPFVLKNVQLGQPSDQLILIARESGGIYELPLLEKAVAISPEDANVLIGLAWHRASDGRNPEALELLQAARAAEPDHVAVYVALGRQLLVQGRFAELVDWANKAPLGADDFGESWSLRGRIAEHQNDSPSAIRCYWESIQRAPESKETNFRLSRLLYAANLPDAAEPFAAHIRKIDHLRTLQDQVLSHGPNERLVFDLAKAYEDAGRIWEAFGWCHLVQPDLRENPKFAELLNRLEIKLKSLPLRQTADSANPAMQVDLASYPLPEFRPIAPPSAGDSLAEVGAVSFREDAVSTGLVFRFFNGSDQPTRRMFELTGGGVGILDYDLDGYPDVCFSQGCPWPPSNPAGQYSDQIFRNDTGQRFENVTALVGFKGGEFGQGVAVGDYNSDGFSDVYLARIGSNHLWANNGDGTFTDVTEAAGLDENEWTTSCLMADLNGDSHPDIYDVNYLAGEKIFERTCRHPSGIAIQCLPFDFKGQPDRLWLNTGDGGFVDATEKSLSVAPDGKGLGIVAWDADGTGRLSLLVANDTTPNFFFTPDPNSANGFRLVEQGLISGLAFNGEGKAEGCMGIALGDVDGNGTFDVHITNFLAESNTLWLCESPGLFEDKTLELGLREPTLNMLGFGTQFLDANLDGLLELFVTNGHVDDLRAVGKPYAMPPQLFQWNGKRFQEADPKRLGSYFQKDWLGRPAAPCDWNRDGLEDLVVGHLYADSALLTNTSPEPGKFLALKLIGTQSARDPVGTLVEVRLGERTWVRQVTAGDGYQCSNSRELIFGVGQSETVDAIIVHWPSGEPQKFERIPTNTHWVLAENDRLLKLP